MFGFIKRSNSKPLKTSATVGCLAYHTENTRQLTMLSWFSHGCQKRNAVSGYTVVLATLLFFFRPLELRKGGHNRNRKETSINTIYNICFMWRVCRPSGSTQDSWLDSPGFESYSGHSSHCVIPVSREFTDGCSRSTQPSWLAKTRSGSALQQQLTRSVGSLAPIEPGNLRRKLV